jgi:hypothetical protein
VRREFADDEWRECARRYRQCQDGTGPAPGWEKASKPEVLIDEGFIRIAIGLDKQFCHRDRRCDAVWGGRSSQAKTSPVQIGVGWIALQIVDEDAGIGAIRRCLVRKARRGIIPNWCARD